MESDAAATRYRSRILREMNANRENPFNSPPSSTGSHGTVSPTMSSVFSDPDGESTRKLNEDIARLTGNKDGKLQVNWEAAHRKWPQFYGMPKTHAQTAARDTAPDHKLTSAIESKENVAPRYLAKFLDDTTQDTWDGSKRTRAEMQPRVDNESDMSSNITRSPARLGMRREMSHLAHQPRTNSPLARTHTRQSSSHQHQLHDDQVDRVDHIRKSQTSPYLGHRHEANTPKPSAVGSMSSKYTPSNLNTIRQTFPSPAATDSPAQNGAGATVNSFFMPDISHLNELVAGTLRFDGAYKNGVPILVKHGKVRDQAEARPSNNHAEVDGFAVPDEEENIFVSMDMIRKEIEDLQEHDDAVQKYAGDLQTQVDQMQKELAQIKSRKSIDSALGSRTGSEPETAAQEQLISEKLVLESQVASLQSRLDQVNQRAGVNEVENNTLSLERDRALKKLQGACENIGDLMDKLDSRERELGDTQKKLDATLQIQNNHTAERDDNANQDIVALKQENKSLRVDNSNLRREQRTLQEEVESLRADNNALRREHESLMAENRSLRTNARSLMVQNEELRRGVDDPQRELASAREEVEILQQDLETMEQEKNTLKEDNDSLVRHNEKYFDENKILRRENSGFERSIQDLHDENLNLKDEVEFLKRQLDHCRPINNEDWSARLGHDDDDEGDVEEEPEENMTSAFFVPDITIDESSVVADPTSETNRGPPDMATQNEKSIEVANTTGPTEISLGQNTADVQKKGVAKSSGKSRKAASQAKDTISQGQKVAFSLPEDTETGQITSNVANKGSKRKSASHKSAHGETLPELEPYREDTTALSSQLTGNHSVTLDIKGKGRKDVTKTSQQTRDQNAMGHSHRVASKSSMKPTHTRSATVDAAAESRHFVAAKDDRSNCPALSSNARRVLDGLCEHNCRNCMVCSRISAHRGTLSRQEAAEGKKRVSVPKPVPATENQLQQYAEDPTMRPSQDPGQALATVIKGLEDEAAHMKMELARQQGRYSELDSSVGRRGRKEVAAEIKACLRRLEVKNDQIYALYDVLEGQKMAGQVMSEEDLEMTVFSITGLSVRDATTSQNFTFEGVMA